MNSVDRLPPQQLDAEASVLGAILLNQNALDDALQVFGDRRHEMFFSEAHQHVFNAMVAAFEKGKPLDVVTLKAQLQAAGKLESAGGVAYLSELTGKVPTSANCEHYAEIVRDAADRRGVITLAQSGAQKALANTYDIRETMGEMESGLFSIAQSRATGAPTEITSLLVPAIDRYLAQIESGGKPTGVPSYFKDLDRITSGWQKGEMIVVAARPSVGKTAFALQCGLRAALDQWHVLIFSCEMSKQDLTDRAFQCVGGVDVSRIKAGFANATDLERCRSAAVELSLAKLWIDDTPNAEMLELRSKARRLAAKEKIELIIIDYLQLLRVHGKHDNRRETVDEISRAVKGLARELDVPVVVMAQLNREGETEPKLSNLRESGSIEQDADKVLLLHPIEVHANGRKQIRCEVAKHRNGPTGKVEFIFQQSMQRFQEAAPPHVQDPGNIHAFPSGGEDYTYDPSQDYDDDEVPF